MLDNTTIVKVTNRDNSYVGYLIPEMGNLRRKFAPQETKELTMEEIRKLSWTDGGRILIKNHLILHNEEAIAEILSAVEPEYFYSEKEVEHLLRYGSAEQLMDALDFAPEGVISLIKDKAVEIKLNDVYKREIIAQKTKFDVSKAIEYNEVSEKVEEVKERRSAPMNMDEPAPAENPAAQVRRTTPVYKVITKEQ